jgi:thiosulfate dehydrogenase
MQSEANDMVDGIDHRFILRGMALALALAVFSSGPLGAQQAEAPTTLEPSRDWLGGIPEAPTEDWEVAFGGRLYDNWAAATDVDQPKGNHPSYPPWGKKKGYATWRCKECHGWDYKGKDGAYAKGSHYTGINGLRDLVGKSPAIVERALRDEIHGYSTAQISEEVGQRLALFVTRGQHDVERFIVRETHKAHGDEGLGERIFQNVCAACHGFDGMAINFKTAKNPEFIGTVAIANPWEALHKIRNGHPGVPMPSLRFLQLQTLVDILAYAQTLPES